jgi:plastocyanin
MDASIAGGMYGMLSILGRKERAPDREFVVVFSPVGQFQGIDHRAFVGNTPVFRARVGELVQWDVMAMGSEHHTFHVHGHRWREPDGRGRDTQTVGPAESFRIRWRERDPGTVAVPLPRRDPHGRRHDRHLPGAPVTGRALGAVLAAALAGPAAAAAAGPGDPHGGGHGQPPAAGHGGPPAAGHGAHGTPATGEASVSMGASAFLPAHVDILAGDTVTWRNDSVRGTR